MISIRITNLYTSLTSV